MTRLESCMSPLTLAVFVSSVNTRPASDSTQRLLQLTFLDWKSPIYTFSSKSKTRKMSLSTIFCSLLLALAPKSSALTWPNEASSSNSDSWLSKHHANIDRVNPKLLVVNFANPTLGTQKAEELVNTVIAGLAEGSRYHGYNSGPKVDPQLEYRVAKFVNLRDGDPGFPPPPAGYPFQNSRQYPRKPPGSPGAWASTTPLSTTRPTRHGSDSRTRNRVNPWDSANWLIRE